MRNYWNGCYNIPYDTFIDYKINGQEGNVTYVLFKGWKHVREIYRELIEQVDVQKDKVNFSLSGDHISAYSPQGNLGTSVTITTTDILGKEYKLDCFF